MELFLNDKEILFIKSLRIKKYIALWKNRTFLLVFCIPLIVCFLEIHPFCLAPGRVYGDADSATRTVASAAESVSDGNLGIGYLVLMDFQISFFKTLYHLGIGIQKADAHLDVLLFFMREGVDGKVSAAIFHTEIFGLTAVYAAESAGCIQGTAAAGIVELDAPDFFGNGFVGNMYLEGTYCSLQVDVGGGSICRYTQPP